MTTTQVSISTTAYVTAHGKAPRGRGSWAFCPADKWNRQDYLDHVEWINGSKTYAEAAQIARERFAEKGIGSIVACS